MGGEKKLFLVPSIEQRRPATLLDSGTRSIPLSKQVHSLLSTSWFLFTHDRISSIVLRGISFILNCVADHLETWKDLVDNDVFNTQCASSDPGKYAGIQLRLAPGFS